MWAGLIIHSLCLSFPRRAPEGAKREGGCTDWQLYDSPASTSFFFLTSFNLPREEEEEEGEKKKMSGANTFAPPGKNIRENKLAKPGRSGDAKHNKGLKKKKRGRRRLGGGGEGRGRKENLLTRKKRLGSRLGLGWDPFIH